MSKSGIFGQQEVEFTLKYILIKNVQENPSLLIKNMLLSFLTSN